MWLSLNIAVDALRVLRLIEIDVSVKFTVVVCATSRNNTKLLFYI